VIDTKLTGFSLQHQPTLAATRVAIVARLGVLGGGIDVVGKGFGVPGKGLNLVRCTTTAKAQDDEEGDQERAHATQSRAYNSSERD
jgi:hypothetical protein